MMKGHDTHDNGNVYRNFAIELAVDFAIMYFVMYTMIATLGHLYVNVNNVYMTLMMVAPMAVVMLVSMRSMFTLQKRNAAIAIAAIAVFVGSFVAMRTQGAVGDVQFLRSMIPHHSGAILMCEQASLTDQDIVALCRDIVAAQKEEIARMQAMLARH